MISEVLKYLSLYHPDIKGIPKNQQKEYIQAIYTHKLNFDYYNYIELDES